MRPQWVKVIMKNGKPYFVKIKSPTFVQSIPWVAECLEDHGISSSNIDRYMVVTGPGRTPKSRIFYYERPEDLEDVPIGQIRCESCKKVVPKNTNTCLNCGCIFNTRLLELTKNGKA